MVVQKMQGSRASYIGCPKNDIRAGCPTSSKNCSLNRDVECLSVGTIIAHSFSERSAHGGSLTIAAKEGPEPHRPARRRAGAHAPQDAGNEPGATGRCAWHQLPASAEKRDRHQSHCSGPVAANLPHPAGAGSFLLRGRTKCSSATRLQWKRVIDGRG